MLSKIPTEFKAGMVFTHAESKSTLTITEVLDKYVTFTLPNGRSTRSTTTFLRDSLDMAGWAYNEKPLDKAMKQLDKQFCLHKNVRRDMYFSAAVYLTCKDCGKALN